MNIEITVQADQGERVLVLSDATVAAPTFVVLTCPCGVEYTVELDTLASAIGAFDDYRKRLT